MPAWFRRRQAEPTPEPEPDSEPPESSTKQKLPDHAVIAHFPHAQDDDLGMIRRLEDHLRDAVADVGEVDGHEVGDGEVIVYLYGPDAEALFTAAEPHLRGFEASAGWCLLRYGGPGDPGVMERRIDL